MIAPMSAENDYLLLARSILGTFLPHDVYLNELKKNLYYNEL